MARTADGREVLRVLATCALSEDDKLIISEGGDTYTFSGFLGLSPEWKTNALSPEGQRWMTACLLAHVNFFGKHVRISLRGAHPALEPAPDEKANYTLEEGAFYGNIFADTPVALSCIGRLGLDKAAAPDLENRACATNIIDGKTVCGFATVGQCSEACTNANADEGGYTDCPITKTEKNTTVSEVITVYLRHQDGKRLK